MELPICIDGSTVGRLELSRQDGTWRARANMTDVARVVRLSLYGRGGSVYLGIPEPDGRGHMTLERTLRRIPEGAEYAAEREKSPPPDETPPEAKRPDEKPRHVVWMGGRPYFF